MAPANTFVLTETGTFEKGGFRIKSSGIKEWPMARGDLGEFSSLSLDQVETVQSLGNGACGSVCLARHKVSGKLLALKVINIIGAQNQRHQAAPLTAAVAAAQAAHLPRTPV